MSDPIATTADGSNGGIKLGMITGVFTPTVLTIVGAIMYLRLGWVVGNAGLAGALAIIFLAHIITVTTALSVASIATNIRVGAGGAYAIIAQSLGLEAGGSIGLPLYVARVTSAVLYVLAFSEGWARIYPEHDFALVSLITFVSVFGISYVSTAFAQRTQVLIMFVIALSLVSIGAGAIPIAEPHTVIEGVVEVKEQKGLIYEPTLWGDFDQGSFWVTFAIFFPAVTGIVAGISLSDCLENPRYAIPVGMLSGVFLTMFLYIGLAYMLSRMATPEALVEKKTILVDTAMLDWAVLAGLAGATFSSALGSLVAAPRVLQALGAHRVLPASDFFATMGKDGEPRRAMLLTAGLTLLTLVVALLGGGLDFVAPLITMFFLLTYAMLNMVVWVEQKLDMVSFRPTFSIPRWIPLVGILSSVFVMFLVNPIFSLLSVLFAASVYWYLLHRKLPGLEEGDVRSGVFLSLAEWAAGMSSAIPAAPERTWQPNVLAPVSSANELRGSYRLLRSLARKGSVRAVGIYANDDKRDEVQGLHFLAKDFQREGIFARATLLEQENLVKGCEAAVELLSATFFPPNILFFRLFDDGDVEEIVPVMRRATEQRMGVIVLLPHHIIELGQEQTVNVWIRGQGPAWALQMRLGSDLSLLVAYELARSWKGSINLCMVVTEEEKEQAEAYLDKLIELSRLGAWAKAKVLTSPFAESLKEAPRADLSIFGLPDQPDVKNMLWLREQVDGSCIMVRDSGNESVLA